MRPSIAASSIAATESEDFIGYVELLMKFKPKIHRGGYVSFWDYFK